MTDEPAALEAVYSDWKVVKTRKVIQLVFEIPVEADQTAYKVMGGMPDHASSRWFAIARLNQQPAKGGREATSPSLHENTLTQPAEEPTPRAPKPFHEKSYTQQAWEMCRNTRFQQYMREQHPKSWGFLNNGTPEERTTMLVRWMCQVKSRSEIKPDMASGRAWKSLMRWYHEWTQQRETA
jgi:hypothetical protein